MENYNNVQKEYVKRKYVGHSNRNYIISTLFKASLVLIMGTICFNGVYDTTEITRTKTETTITNELNGLDYDYDIAAYDYDYSFKLKQLSNFKNVFDIQPLQSVAVNDLRTPSLMPMEYPYIVAGLSEGYIFITEYTFIDFNGDEQTINYYDWNLLGSAVIMFNHDLDSQLDLFVNKRNYVDYINLNYYGDISLPVEERVFFYIDRVFIFLNAPLIWLYNFVYDVGVFITFIVYW